MQAQSKEEFFVSLDRKAVQYLTLCNNSAQTTFLTLQEKYELDDSGVILKALTPFPGIAQRGETCGAVISKSVSIAAEIIMMKYPLKQISL